MNSINQTHLANAEAWQSFVLQNSAYRHSFTGVRLGDVDEEHYPTSPPTSYPCTVVYYCKHEDGRAYICYEFVYMMQTPREVVAQMKNLAFNRLLSLKGEGMEKAAEWQYLESLMTAYESWLAAE